MKDRGKRVMEWEGFESRCRRHPSQKEGSGICPLCLMDRLNDLFCPDCGELRQRHSSPSSCSCSEASTSSSSAADFMKKKGNNNNNSNGGGGGSVEVGSVGRISFLIESDRPEFDSSKDAILMLRRSKSAAVGSTRIPEASSSTMTATVRAVRTPEATVVATTRLEPRTPKSLPVKKWYTIFSFVLSKKKRKAKGDHGKDSGKGPRLSSGSNNGGTQDRIVVERFVKSKSVAVGRRSYSGYFWENSGHGDLKSTRAGTANVYCTPSRVNGLEVKGTNPVAEENSCQPRRRSGKGWNWAFASPMRVFKHSKALKSNVATNNPPSPCSVAEMCRG